MEDTVRSRFAGRHILITGCSRGIGLGLARHLVSAGAVVLATCRSPDEAGQLQAAIASPSSSAAPGCRVLQCDVTSPESIKSMAGAVRESLPEGVGLDMVVNNAGIATTDHPDDNITNASKSDMASLFETNAIGPVLITQALLPLMDCPQSLKLVVNLSSALASIELAFGQGGGIASYRISRAAANMAVRTFAAELSSAGFTCLALSPGHVATDMGCAKGRSPPLTVDDSARGMLNVMAAAQPSTHNGMYMQYDGTPLPW